jgi:hypothetical protein
MEIILFADPFAYSIYREEEGENIFFGRFRVRKTVAGGYWNEKFKEGYQTITGAVNATVTDERPGGYDLRRVEIRFFSIGSYPTSNHNFPRNFNNFG